MTNKKYIFFALSIVMLVVFYATTFNFTYSEPAAIKVLVNNQSLKFDVPPVNINSRVLVPFRVISEALGAEVTWDEVNQSVVAKKEDATIKLTIGNRTAFINNRSTTLDVAPQIIDGRTMIPVRFISEGFGAEVEWDGTTQTVYISSGQEATKISYQGLSIGSSLEEVSKILGTPIRIDNSEYGFKWYVFHQEYMNYVQVGIKDSRVVALYSNSSNWDSKELNIGSAKALINSTLKDPIDRIQKGNVIYLLSKDEGTTVYRLDNNYLTVFFDLHDNNKVTSLLIIDKNIEEGYLPTKQYTDELRKAYELQAFDLANSIRVRMGLSLLNWSDQAASSSLKHSQDMATLSYFDHNNLKGETPTDRMKKEGIVYSSTGENLAAGQQNAIYAHEGWMNSLGHREILLADFKNLGVGVAFGGPYKVYYTQNYYTAR